ncbi:ArsR/SmtB family transcription factor [Nocardia asteroides]|uniref:ArsR/SmtB family transcription factor n=1 Tax=Nocardia asteroides TaxID=1824 RepID=UPI001E47C926|nr:helix-turn-helix domain-containing protein [Nocardia asteroides]UGT56769.1 helix-turn-helix domain-containing protein [Nocardia asteroides]
MAEAEELELGAVLAALADPLRRRVITLLALDPDDGDRSCSSFDLPVTKATRTHHFRVLRQAGLVRQIDYGNRSTVALRRADLDARFPGLLDLLVAEGP